MDYFHLLEVVASEVFTSNAMARHDRTAQYLSALATLSQALARRQQALSEIDRYRDLLTRTDDDVLKSSFQILRQQAERDQELAELELRGIDLWVNTISGGFMSKDELSQALKGLADEVAGTAFDRIFSGEEAFDAIVAAMGAGHQR